MIQIKTFDGFSLASASYLSVATSAKKAPDAKPVFIEQSKADSVYSDTYTLEARSVAVTVRVLNYATRDVLEAQLKEACRQGKKGMLVGTFSDDGRDYQLECVVTSCQPIKEFTSTYLIIFQTGESAWKTVAKVTDTWAVSASGATKDITVGGYSPTRLCLSLTPTVLPAGGWAYQNLQQLVNIPGYAYPNRPWCLALDTAALVTAGKMQSSCNDIVVVVDGVIAKRWISDPNTNHTHIWFNLNISAGRSMKLLTSVASSGVITSLAFAKTADSAAALTALPSRGYLQHGTEWFEYTAKDITNYKVTGITRGALGTTMQAHSAADVFNWIEHSIFLLYGNGAATNPSLTDASYDDTKPVFDLSASDNANWVYTASTKFYDPDKPNRTGAWMPSITRVGNVSKVYQNAGDAEGAAPSMGMKLSTWYKAGIKQAEKAILAWTMKNNGGIATVSMTGRKYRNTVSWPGTKAAIFQRSNDNTIWYEVWYEASPSALTTWESINHASATITGNMKIVRFSLSGSLAALADVDTFFEVATATVVFVSANLPTGTFLGEKGNYLLSVYVKNDTTGDLMSLVFPMLLNKAMALEAEEYSVLYDSINAASALKLDDESRAVWIRLNPGVNHLVLTGDDVATLTVVPSWYERRL